jgi:hypothetical protein
MYFLPLSPCGRGWINREAVETGEGGRKLRAQQSPASDAGLARPTINPQTKPTLGKKDRYSAASSRGGVGRFTATGGS